MWGKQDIIRDKQSSSMEVKHSAWIHHQENTKVKSLDRIGFHDNCYKSNSNDESCNWNQEKHLLIFKTAIKLDYFIIIEIDGNKKNLVKNFLNLVNSSEHSTWLVLLRSERMARLGIAELLSFLDFHDHDGDFYACLIPRLTA